VARRQVRTILGSWTHCGHAKYNRRSTLTVCTKRCLFLMQPSRRLRI
jgi:hypothetical protein